MELTYEYTDVADGRVLDQEEVLRRSAGFRDFDGRQLTGVRISAYMLSLVGIKRCIVKRADGTPCRIENV